jgi:hypothetical protein
MAASRDGPDRQGSVSARAGVGQISLDARGDASLRPPLQKVTDLSSVPCPDGVGTPRSLSAPAIPLELVVSAVRSSKGASLVARATARAWRACRLIWIAPGGKVRLGGFGTTAQRRSRKQPPEMSQIIEEWDKWATSGSIPAGDNRAARRRATRADRQLPRSSNKGWGPTRDPCRRARRPAPRAAMPISAAPRCSITGPRAREAAAP